MEQHELQFQFKARYFKTGRLDASTKQLWFVIHGYGQLAEYFIRKFKILEDHNVCVIAPEGLSHFYLEDVGSRSRTGNNRVGASWMTKENRLIDIENYLEYLNQIYKKITENNFAIPITILGFSQGAATASRWIGTGKISFDRFILWAGVFPQDMDFETTKEILKEKETFLVYGNADPFINADRVAEINTVIDKLEISPVVKVFEGKHDIDSETLMAFV